MSSLTITLVDRMEALEALVPEWNELAHAGGAGGFFRSPSWLLPWYRSYGPALGAGLHVLAVREGRDLVGLAPFYERSTRVGPGVRTREIRLIGDAGPRPPALDLLVRSSYDEAFGETLADWLTTGHGPPWDIMDLMPLRQVSRARAFLAERLAASGRRIESHEASSTLTATLTSALEAGLLPPSDPGVKVVTRDEEEIRKTLAALRRLSRLEWASRDEGSPLADEVASKLLADVLMARDGRLCRIEGEDGDVMAAAVIIDDPPRAVCIAFAVDPEKIEGGERLLATEARTAAERGLTALDVVLSAAEVPAPPVPVTVKKSLRLRAYNSTAAGTVARTYTRLKKRATTALDSPGAAAAGARSAWTKIRGGAKQIATYERLHLYRGELWVRGIAPPDGLAVTELPETAFDALSREEQEDIISRLELDEAYCREKWQRGDLVIYATLARRAAGIAWCARTKVYVPEIQREVRPGAYECYIHDVFVAPDARGRNVAPVMLEELARRLRQRDVYRAWALIHPNNVASTRAFDKAAYASVADVIYAKVGAVDKMVLRPPDQDGRRLLGLT